MPAPVKKQSDGTSLVIVSAQKKRSGEFIKGDTKTAQLQCHDATAQIVNPASVSTKLAITKNMNNFESMSVAVMITSPCENTNDAKLAAQKRDMNLAMEMLEAEAAAVSTEWF